MKDLMAATMKDFMIKPKPCPLLEETEETDECFSCAQSIRRAVERMHLQPSITMDPDNLHPSPDTVQEQCRGNFKDCTTFMEVVGSDGDPISKTMTPLGYTANEVRDLLGVKVLIRDGTLPGGFGSFLTFTPPDGQPFYVRKSQHTGALFAPTPEAKQQFDKMMGINQDLGPTQQVCLADVGTPGFGKLMDKHNVGPYQNPDRTLISRLNAGAIRDPETKETIFIDIPESAQI